MIDLEQRTIRTELMNFRFFQLDFPPIILNYTR